MSQKQRDYMDEVYNLAISLGIPEPQARLAAAQSSLETGYGNHAPGNAYFGMKAGSSWDGPTQTLKTHEEENGALVAINDKFRVYDDKAASLADWWDRLQVRWPEAAAATTFEDAVNGLKAGKTGGYATDNNYAGKLASIDQGRTPRPPGDIPEGVASSVDTGTYSIRSGDTLGKLAEKFGTTVEALSKANGISDPNRIYAGQTLRLPTGGQARPRTQPQPPLGSRQPANILPPGPLIQPQDIRDAFFDPLPAPSPLEAPGVWQGPVLGGGTQGNVLGGAPKPMPGRPASLNGTVPLPREGAPATTTPEAPQPTGGGFNLGSMIGDLGNTLGQTANNVGKTLGNAATNVVEGTKAGLEKTAESVKDTLTNELIGTVKGRTLLMNTALGIQPRRDPAADRRISAPEGFAYGATGKKLYKIGQTYNSSRGQVVFDGSKFVPAGTQVRSSVDVPPSGLAGRQAAQQADYARRGLNSFGMLS